MPKALSVFAVAFLAATTNAWADCKVHAGNGVVLYGTTEDPSVLAWDSRTRLRDYQDAPFAEARAMLSHAQLISPGTNAEVTSCVPSYVSSPLFAAPQDAIGVTITSGQLRGKTGWVLGSDVRPVHKPQHR